jgi:hypothetical protein
MNNKKIGRPQTQSIRPDSNNIINPYNQQQINQNITTNIGQIPTMPNISYQSQITAIPNVNI